ncbi:MAG: cation diffusion facilitator family transporter [Candidatus Eremiobacteraeota bacterium]|nr:cation diffusion facilitator family transporter [Candidatus Eremiobacteraeota bacterium]
MAIIKTKTQVTYFSVGMNVFLTLFKIAVSFITGSTAILSEALHSGSDLVTSLIAMFSVREAEKPPDSEHPYGHGKYENVASLLESLVIFGSGFFILYRSIIRIKTGVELASLDLGIVTMFVAAIVNFFVSSYLIRKGRELESPAIEADGWHSRTDVYTATGVMVSLIVVKFTGINILDPIIAIGVALVILWVAVRIFLESLGILVDKCLPPEEEKRIRDIIGKHKDEYLEFHRMRSRKKGGEREVDLHLVFLGNISLKKAHDLASHLEDEVKQEFPGIKVLIHMEPCDDGKNIVNENKQCDICEGCKKDGNIGKEN